MSDQCANDYCGQFGTCYIINSQLNLVSACKCQGGYEGYDCTDATNAVPMPVYLSSILFLTLSNLVFLLPIAMAIYRGWYIEALIYFYNMFFSAFYHACDQELNAFCIFNYDGLQLADFISSYTSFVITVLAMSSLKRPWKVFSYFFGILACLSINLYDRFNNIAFAVFLCASVSVTLMTWIRVCFRTKKLHPKLTQIIFLYFPGLLLAIAGLLIYSRFQTKSNYWILHSVWHMCMASSIVFFLPKKTNKEFNKVELIDLDMSASSENFKGKMFKHKLSSLFIHFFFSFYYLNYFFFLDVTSANSSPLTQSTSSSNSNSNNSINSTKETITQLKDSDSLAKIHLNLTEVTLLNELQ